MLEFLDNSGIVENRGESDHLLEILEILEFLDIPPVKDPFRNDPFFQSRHETQQWNAQSSTRISHGSSASLLRQRSIFPKSDECGGIQTKFKK